MAGFEVGFRGLFRVVVREMYERRLSASERVLHRDFPPRWQPKTSLAQPRQEEGPWTWQPISVRFQQVG